MTALLGRAAACIGAGRWDPERLGTAIARCRICVERAEGRVVTQAQIRTRHVRRERAGAVAEREALLARVS